MRDNIILIGGGNQAHYTLDIINDQDEYNVVGIIDSLHPIGSMVHGLRVLGRQSEILKICKKFNVKNAVITIGDNYTRFKVKAELERIMPDLKYPNIIHSSVIISKTAKLGKASVIMAGCIVNPRAELGDCVFLATGAQIEHDCVIGPYASISAGTVLGGYVKIGKFSALALSVTVFDRVVIEENTVIGSGSLVTKSLPANVLAYGSPVKIKKNIELGYKFLK